MAETTCAHPGCECTLPTERPFGKFCSEYCREHGKMTELACHCGHPQCDGDTSIHGKAPAAAADRLPTH